jgi:hypothetical protein
LLLEAETWLPGLEILVLDDCWTLLNDETLLPDVEILLLEIKTPLLEIEILVLDNCWILLDVEIKILLGDC